MAALRSIPGPLMVALGVWCAAGHLTVVDDRLVGVRLAVPAPVWVFFAVLVTAGCVSAWRRRPTLATPALLSTLPWWPVPLPAIALIWTGPLAWAPIAAAIGAASVEMLRTRRDHLTSLPRPPRHAIAAGLAVLAAGAAVAWSVDPRLPGGDEPHYLVITQSLLSDGDLRIQNNHDRHDYAAYFDGVLAPDSLVRGKDGQIYSIHAPGVAVLVLPAFAVFGYHGAQALILIAAALTASLVWWIGWLVTGRIGAAWFAWAAVCGSVTFLIQSVSIYPDGPAALVTAAACWLLVRLSMRGTHERTAVLVAISALLASLPWLHTRLAVLAAGFGVAIVVGVLAEAGSVSSRLRRVASFAAIPAISAAAWLLFFLRIYGTPDPRAPYGPMRDASLAFVPGGLTGLVFDQQFGLLVYTPVLLAIVGLLAARQPGPTRASVLWPLAIAGMYLAAVTTVWMWWAGRPATPARFANAVLPVFAAPLALVFARSSPAMRTVWLVLLGVSAGIAACVLGVDRGALAWNDRTAQALWLDWLTPLVNLPRGYPSFFWRLDPAALASQSPFFIHSALWLAGAVVTTFVVVRMASGEKRTAAGRVAIVTWGGAAAWMLLVLAGWVLNGVNGLDPERSQMSVLEQLGRGRPAYTIAGFSVARAVAGDLAQVTVRSEEAGKVDPSPPWLILNGVPPGKYTLRVLAEMPKPGPVRVHVGNHLYRTLDLVQANGVDLGLRQQIPLSLPAGAATLVVRPDGDLRGIHATAEIVPVIVKGSTLGLARSAMRSDGSDVFFLDENAYPEETGFWTRGERTASFVFATDPGRPAIALNLRNGPQPNVVTVRAGALTLPETLQPSETRTLAIPVDPEGLVTISVTTSRGFRPADVSGSRDRRYLGVWVEIK